MDVLGLVIAVLVFAASVHDNAVGIALLDKVSADTDTAENALADQASRTRDRCTSRTRGRKVRRR
ncbi:hypothetical protein SAV14893_082710 [Streptomyces avermitilis]|uniref:Uncharacterized protein n=1 Tax=Streptomyces avermitilis TaxID=33903 RepID=A0A4D4MFH9_STRAX|nr:hypothetical protein SAV14893_082710 [Streptomyces avermitilis]GDY70738.1 hypothetical protein SAV31267_002230 [Streptomyces avermitilis]